jgi:diaminohydroxyphosphoribosylaminopyrimidine deaminase/5-amino-6-(5-phosphoribosylamino)uracil reductase
MIDAADREYLALALRLAERGLYTTTPNPRVGCVLVKDGEVIAEGWHERAGEAHAEAMALGAAGAAACGATAYVSLEPCSHHGRTPPCADALVAAGVRRVVAAMSDPNPRVAGQGLARLRAAGIEVDCGALEDEARDLNIGFVSRMQRGRPWLRLKIAATVDGKTALLDGASRWITGPEARRDGHAWRARACAVLTGMGTVREDDPQLTVRDVPTTRQPLRVVVDSRMQIAPGAKVLAGGGALLAAAREDADKRRRLEALGVEVIVLPGARGEVDLTALIEELGRREINELHVEAGRTLDGALLRGGLVDELVLYLAPAIVGDRARGMFDLPPLAALAGRMQLDFYDLCRVGRDLRIIARVTAGGAVAAAG